MTTPPPYYGPPAQPANDKTTLWGVLGIVFAFCCSPLGIVFGILSLMEAKKVGKEPTLGYIAIGLSALLFVVGIVLNVTGVLGGLTGGKS
ncbi:hypothetical protein EV385_3899 [Krasilnikovia cinnamomea]|uniref:DUF4190 domain-containing protein n=1 Tax=Krasilnikovia cinnamomea TaxID=349313 RepID=A0A4Q7ZM44_9ACTN|nr:DUF4190 domain-containing protein [Krasilnikovia cinnamomea]RZU52058.1 hypothetical protein EV385_3899 [Krasilnikovia cinnamomea]